MTLVFEYRPGEQGDILSGYVHLHARTGDVTVNKLSSRDAGVALVACLTGLTATARLFPGIVTA
jgi:hypothetical protein